MGNYSILIADNDESYLETACYFFEDKGFNVLQAKNPTEAEHILKQKDKVDLAILDIRLINNDDDRDTSGLVIAKTVAMSVPKIILTAYPSLESVREALGPQVNGLHIAADYVCKKEGLESLLTSIRKVIKLNKTFNIVKDAEIHANQLNTHYTEALTSARIHSRTSLLVAVMGIAIIFICVMLAAFGKIDSSIPGVMTGVIVEAISILFFKRADKCYERADELHGEHLMIAKTMRIEELLSLCNELSIPERRDECKEEIIKEMKNILSRN